MWKIPVKKIVIIITLLILTISAGKHYKFYIVKNFVLTIISKPLEISEGFFYDIKNILNYKELVNQNKELRYQVKVLTDEIFALQEASVENKRLRGLLSFRDKMPYEMIAAEVIAKDSTNWRNSVIINSGKKDGLKVNMTVVASGGLVGRVVEVFDTKSKIILLTDCDSKISALNQRNRELGIIRFFDNNLCRMDYLDLKSDITHGDIIMTAGTGKLFPKGIMIGKVVFIDDDISGLYKYALVKPSADIKNLEEVFVIKK